MLSSIFAKLLKTERHVRTCAVTHFKIWRRGFVTLLICKALVPPQVLQTGPLLMLIDSSSKRKVCKDSKAVVCIPVLRRSAGLASRVIMVKIFQSAQANLKQLRDRNIRSGFIFAVIRVLSLMLQGYMHSLKFLEQKLFQLGITVNILWNGGLNTMLEIACLKKTQVSYSICRCQQEIEGFANSVQYFGNSISINPTYDRVVVCLACRELRGWNCRHIHTPHVPCSLRRNSRWKKWSGLILPDFAKHSP